MDFVVGQMVRSFDFPDSPIRAKHYVEGVFLGVEKSGRFQGRLAIRVTKVVRDGEVYMDSMAVKKAEEDAGEEYIVYPPPNGIQNWCGGVTDGVEAV